jgi:hypothetical protein
MSRRPHDLKSQFVYWGITLLFVVKFGKFLVVEIWDVVSPLFAQAP